MEERERAGHRRRRDKNMIEAQTNRQKSINLNSLHTKFIKVCVYKVSTNCQTRAGEL